jgi:hypothetical protein
MSYWRRIDVSTRSCVRETAVEELVGSGERYESRTKIGSSIVHRVDGIGIDIDRCVGADME